MRIEIRMLYQKKFSFITPYFRHWRLQRTLTLIHCQINFVSKIGLQMKLNGAFLPFRCSKYMDKLTGNRTHMEDAEAGRAQRHTWAMEGSEWVPGFWVITFSALIAEVGVFHHFQVCPFFSIVSFLACQVNLFSYSRSLLRFNKTPEDSFLYWYVSELQDKY